jgi:glyoxylase-like metal-dependent hydrolase (beta-lactamase superfamily II)
MRLATCALLLALALPAAAQQDFSAVEIKATALRGGLHMLVGRGGNLVVSAGTDGVYLIDDQYAPLVPKIRAAIAAISEQPVRFVINTHWHGDHTGGNEAFGGSGSVIVAHDNVRRRMSTEQVIKLFGNTVPPAPAAALPVLTFTEQVSLHFNGDTADVIHVAHAHTDGDAFVHFRAANVLHMGDLYFNGLYPFIDTGSGGDIDGLIAALDRALALADDQTQIVPGHGPLSNKAEMAAYRTMLDGFRSAIRALKTEGRTLEQAQAAAPTAAFDEKLGGAFIKPAQLVAFIYETVD